MPNFKKQIYEKGVIGWINVTFTKQCEEGEKDVKKMGQFSKIHIS